LGCGTPGVDGGGVGAGAEKLCRSPKTSLYSNESRVIVITCAAARISPKITAAFRNVEPALFNAF
jgi:hypothetical protein